ncbi:hypothetical protein [Streptomyces sp. NPDC018711]|uniref:hypothetical protein n=1 Tax=Streptomyces sp. NPDC018711 TaxID=3365052 RepID=UPI0037B728A3
MTLPLCESRQAPTTRFVVPTPGPLRPSDVGAAADRVGQELVDAGLEPAEKIPDVDKQTAPFPSDQPEKTQGAAHALDVPGNRIPVLTTVIAAAGVFLAHRRRRALTKTAPGAAFGATCSSSVAVGRDEGAVVVAGDRAVRVAEEAVARVPVVVGAGVVDDGADGQVGGVLVDRAQALSSGSVSGARPAGAGGFGAVAWASGTARTAPTSSRAAPTARPVDGPGPEAPFSRVAVSDPPEDDRTRPRRRANAPSARDGAFGHAVIRSGRRAMG